MPLALSGDRFAVPGKMACFSIAVSVGDVHVVMRLQGAGPVPAGATGGEAHAIADDGTIVGAIFPEVGYALAYEWAPNGIGHVLLGPTGDPARAVSQIDDRWIVGAALVGPHQVPGAVRWNRATGAVEVINPDEPLVVMAASGAYLTGPGPRLIRGAASVRIPGAFALSDDGTRVVGRSGDQVVIWHC